MCIMTSKFNILHFKGTILFKHFLMREWLSAKVTFSKFIAYLPHITGCFHLHCAVISLTNVNVNVLLTQFYGLCKAKHVLLSFGSINPVLH